MSTVYPSRKTPHPEMAPFTPPLTPPSSASPLTDESVPADQNIPDNYVDYTLKNTKPLSPVSWKNWWRELNYVSVIVLTVTPTLATYGAFTTKLRWETMMFSVFYYFVTGLGT
jgi:stearoyl-CoA desaturase (Delta-9 desaturase)